MAELGYLVGALAVLVGVALRVQAGRLARRAVGDTDEIFHRVYVEVIRDNGHRLPAQFPSFAGPGRNTYPAAYHWALSFLPPRWLETVARYGALAADLILAGCVSWLLVAKTQVPGAGALLLAGLYLVSPALTLNSIGPRSFHLTPRMPAQVLYGAVILVLVAGNGRISLALAAVVVLLLAILLLTSKFALQVVLIAAPVLALTIPSWVPLACFAAAFPVAAVISGGFLLRQLRAQGEHLEWYVKRHLRMVRKPAWEEIGRALRRRDLRRATRIVTLQNPLTSGLVRHLHLLAAGIWLLARQPALSPAQTAAAAFTLAGVAGWLATTGGILRVLGEPERYLEFAFPASWFLFWSLFGGTLFVIVAALGVAYEAAWHVFNIKVMTLWVDRATAIRRDRELLLAALADQAPATALFLDIKDAYAVNRIPGIRAVMFSGQMSLHGGLAGFLDWFFWRYPLVHPQNLEAITERFGVDVIVAKQEADDLMRADYGEGYDLARYPTLFKNEQYTLVSVSSVPSPPLRPTATGSRMVSARSRDPRTIGRRDR